jgi:hypothetical protein
MQLAASVDSSPKAIVIDRVTPILDLSELELDPSFGIAAEDEDTKSLRTNSV